MDIQGEGFHTSIWQHSDLKSWARGFFAPNFIILGLISSLTPRTAAALTFELAVSDSKSHEVSFVSSVYQWNPIAMRERTPGMFSISFPEPVLPEIQYKFLLDGKWTLDPHNPITAPDGWGGANNIYSCSHYATPIEAEPSLEFSQYSVKALKITDYNGELRTINLLLPVYRTSGRSNLNKSVNLVIFHDGDDYLKQAEIRRVLAYRTAKSSTTEWIGIAISSIDRMEEYGLGARSQLYSKWLTQTLIPLIEKRFIFVGPRRGLSSAKRIAVGPSLGGLFSFYQFLSEPGFFNGVIAQSASVWFARDQIQSLALAYPTRRRVDPSILAIVDYGNFETDNLISAIENVSPALKAKLKNQFEIQSYPSTHSWIAWANRIPSQLEEFE